MSSRPLVILGIVIIAVAIVAAAGFVLHGKSTDIVNSNIPIATTTEPAKISPTFYQSTSTGNQSATSGSNPQANSSSSLSTKTDNNNTGNNTVNVSNSTNGATSTYNIPLPASTTIDTSSWKIYVDNQNNYSIEYPTNMNSGVNGNVLTLVFPKNIYFHWPLQDDAKITVTAATSCPEVSQGYEANLPDQISLNSYAFTRSIATDVGAGQRYLEIVYDSKSNGKCFHIDFLDHGANGAGFYVDDMALVKKYDAEHDADMTAIYAIINGIVGTFHILAPTH